MFLVLERKCHFFLFSLPSEYCCHVQMCAFFNESMPKGVLVFLLEINTG